MTDEKMKKLAACMGAICTGKGNPIAWIILEEAGHTQDAIRAASEGPGWEGAKPVWSSVPSDGMRAAYAKSKAAEAAT